MKAISTVSSIVAFFVGIVVGAIGCALVLYRAYRRAHQRKSDSLPAAPLYDIAGPPTVTVPAPCEDGTPPQVQLDENIAYGQMERKKKRTITD